MHRDRFLLEQLVAGPCHKITGTRSDAPFGQPGCTYLSNMELLWTLLLVTCSNNAGSLCRRSYKSRVAPFRGNLVRIIDRAVTAENSAATPIQISLSRPRRSNKRIRLRSFRSNRDSGIGPRDFPLTRKCTVNLCLERTRFTIPLRQYTGI